jgi:hypothetical protein
VSLVGGRAVADLERLVVGGGNLGLVGGKSTVVEPAARFFGGRSVLQGPANRRSTTASVRGAFHLAVYTSDGTKGARNSPNVGYNERTKVCVMGASRSVSRHREPRRDRDRQGEPVCGAAGARAEERTPVYQAVQEQERW